mgnify:CR=1 FL=1
MSKDTDNEQKHSRTAYADGPRLLADIGATHARFALETAPGVLRSVRVLKCDDFSGIVPLLHSYLADHKGTRINHAAFALANPGYELGERILFEVEPIWPADGCCTGEPVREPD